MKVKKGYVTLVMLVDSEEALNKVRAMADSSVCKAWSMTHELNRLTLIEDALEKGEIARAKSYIDLADVPDPDVELCEVRE
jgi:hypothetical protein